MKYGKLTVHFMCHRPPGNGKERFCRKHADLNGRCAARISVVGISPIAAMFCPREVMRGVQTIVNVPDRLWTFTTKHVHSQANFVATTPFTKPWRKRLAKSSRNSGRLLGGSVRTSVRWTDAPSHTSRSARGIGLRLHACKFFCFLFSRAASSEASICNLAMKAPPKQQRP